MAKDQDSKTISMSELARLSGISRVTLYKYLDEGKVPFKLNAAGAKIINRKDALAAVEDVKNQNNQKYLVDKQTTSSEMSKAKTVREVYNAKISRLNYETKIKELIKVEAVEARLFELSLQVRDSVLNVPNKISAELASMTDERKINSFLDETLRDCLESISEGEFEKWRLKKLRA